ncbi:hypothetical protein PoB_002917900 [Plakobranchus ocellatus]|uniref:Uncharacterized protein n=1 Tax=Plakobranchus ocellatus TaxID=259542 RepID=A0AAV4A4R3_9GAST|nr:hypothetical protein PoB_002917900 [Plakobranchus ocellatus]
MLIDIVKHLTGSDMLFDAKDLNSCVAKLSFNTTMQPLTRQNAQRNGLNITAGTLFPIHPTVQTLHPQTFIYLGPLSATWEAKSLRMKMSSLVKSLIGFQSLTQTFSLRAYTRFSHDGKNA